MGELINADLEVIHISAVSKHTWFVEELNNVDLEVVPIPALQHTWFVEELNNADLEVVPISAELASIHGF